MPNATATAEPASDFAEEHPEGPHAFAGAQRLAWAEMLGAPVRWPRPSRLRGPLDLPAGKMADGIAALGLSSVGGLLEHLPRDHREARTVAQLRAGEQATVAVQVRSIAGRPVRRRGMRDSWKQACSTRRGR